MTQIGPIIGLLAASAVLVTLWGLLSNWEAGQPIFGGVVLTGVTLLITAGLLLIYIPIATIFGQSIMPSDLSLDKVFGALHWKLSSDPLELSTVAWGVSFTLMLPLISAFWEIVMLVAAIIAVATSIASSSFKGVVFVASQILGWGLFLAMYDTFVTLIGTYYPTWDMSFVAVFTSAFYTAGTLFLVLACYIGLPWLAASLVPSPSREKVAAARNKKIDWEYLMALPVLIRHKEDTYEEGEIDVSGSGDDGFYGSTGRPNGPKGPDSPSPVYYLPSGLLEDAVLNQDDVIHITNSEHRENDDLSHASMPEISEIHDNPETIDANTIRFSGKASSRKTENDSLAPEDEKHPQSVKESNRLKLLKKAGDVLTLAGAVTHEPKLVVGGKAAKFVSNVAEEISNSDADPKEVLLSKAQGVAERAAETLFPDVDPADLLRLVGKKGGKS
ncbi:MAG: hypothetical protein UV49_C0026G0018 [candidate division WWE3 bacterium GW2011_GWA2_42_9]|nr:MAG: hypothetical protein UV49_C0026G0018 [candidate division WWE3 bacterium GW2011_GWA2_42_9]